MKKSGTGLKVLFASIVILALIIMAVLHLFTSGLITLAGSMAAVLFPGVFCLFMYNYSVKQWAVNKNSREDSERHYAERVTTLEAEITRLQKENREIHACTECRDSLDKVFLHYRQYTDVLHSFINSIIDSLNDASAPLSEEIFNIKARVQEFMYKLKVWDDLLNGLDSSRNFATVIDQYSDQNERFERVSDRINLNYQELESRLQTVVGMIDRIRESSEEISDISEKIKVLSINASIESSRAGHFGDGFKVIAGEIKRLSDNTQSRINAIKETVGTAHENAADTLTKFRGDCGCIAGMIDDQKGCIGEFYQKLIWYQEYFETLFATVSELTDKTNVHINSFSPVFQKHDIAFQELENVERMCASFENQYQDTGDAASRITDDSQRLKAVEDIIDIVQHTITTDNEIELVNRLAEKYGLDIRMDIGQSNEVEFF